MMIMLRAMNEVDFWIVRGRVTRSMGHVENRVVSEVNEAGSLVYITLMLQQRICVKRGLAGQTKRLAMEGKERVLARTKSAMECAYMSGAASY